MYVLLLQEWSQGKRLKRTLITTMTFTGPSSGTTAASSSSSPAAAASSSNNEKGAVETDLILSLKAATLVNGPDGGTRAAAVEAFSRLNEQAQQAHIVAVIKMLDLPTARGRHAALKVLDVSLPVANLSLVVRSLGDPAACVRTAALDIIKKVTAAKVEQHVAAIVALLQKDETDVLRIALATLASPAG